MQEINRRGFVRQAAAGVGGTFAAAALGAAPAQGGAPAETERLPREVWVASISQNGLSADTPEQMVELLLARMELAAAQRPDIICLPEVGPFVNLTGDSRTPVKEAAGKYCAAFTARLAGFARSHNCYVWAPLYTQEGGRCYNALVLIDRRGQVQGEYRKMHPTLGEMEDGVSPGPLEPTVFDTDFGRIGAQICFDIEWKDGWEKLGKAGAEIVFWSSAFGGGRKLNLLANLFRYNVVSSTRKGVSQVVDITGQSVAWTGLWEPSLCTALNLEKAYVHTWPFSENFDKVRAKYGRAVRLTTFMEEEWSIVESLSPEVKVADVLREFGIKSYDQLIQESTAEQDRKRG
ncbi:carbon-nitrogen hydrolase family protein [bacterium]|nr:carbon-nitrogen hydrolase family protein [bacterium]